jgi:hypothetical protein
MQVPQCRHIKTNGEQCQSPSLNRESWCYFHSRLHQRMRPFRTGEPSTEPASPAQSIQLNLLEDRESVQVAISVVLNALASGQLELRRATALLYGLQLASSNTSRPLDRPLDRYAVRKVESSPEGEDMAEASTLDVTYYR